MRSKSPKSGPPTPSNRPEAGLRNIRLDLEYDGSGFFGFQKQPGHPTVQEALESALSRLFSRPVKIRAASGRTDAGVHAAGQVVNFLTDSPLEVSLIRRGLNALLPKPMAVRTVREMPAGFHARYDARSKVYEYRVWNHSVRSPLYGLRAFHVPYALDVREMRRAAKLLTGRHDFRSFAGTGSSATEKGRGTVRMVSSFRVISQGDLVIFRVEADGFLYHMVRNLAGMLLAVGKGKLALADVPRILKAKDRKAAPGTAPARGLCLVCVRY